MNYTSIGLIGGSRRRANTSSQFTCLKNGCPRTAAASLGPEPNLCET